MINLIPIGPAIAKVRVYADGPGLTSHEKIATVHYVLGVIRAAKPPFKAMAL
jgi:hypothetical protein